MVERKPIGRILCDETGPTQSMFSFVVEEGCPVKHGQFVEVEGSEGRIVGVIVNLTKTNRYFRNVEAVKVCGEQLPSAFLTDRWEALIASVQILGVQNGCSFDRVSFPPSPGQQVYLLEGESLASFLGFAPDGLEIGYLRHYSLPVRLSLNRLFQKHIAILAMSGAGKSFCARTIIEQLLERKSKRPAVIVVDVHGEYANLAEVPEYSGRVSVIKGTKMRIGVPNLSASNFLEFIPDMSEIQARELQLIINKLREGMKFEGKPYGLDELIAGVQKSDMNQNIRTALLGWLFDLKSLNIFAHYDDPSLNSLLSPGTVVVLDFKPIVSLRKKQILVTHIVRRLFELRKADLVPPFVLILEEAHQFAPSEEKAISKSAIETVAREGRKFSASLVVISQRPVRLSTTVLSQMGTNIILRMTNPYDLDHIKKSSEAITAEVAHAISLLPVGEALIVGEAVNFPIFVKIKTPKHPPTAGLTFEEAVEFYENKEKRELSDIISIMGW